MKRALLSIGGTVVGLVALLDFKSHGSAGRARARSRTAARPRRPRRRRRRRRPPRRTARGRNRRRSTSAAANVARKVSGDPMQTYYGVVQVSVA